MATFFGPKFIEPPPPPPRPYGLFDVALGPIPFPVEEAVGGGIQYIPDTCESNVYLYDMTCPPVSGSKTFDVLDTSISGSPFAVITEGPRVSFTGVSVLTMSSLTSSWK